jgi:hypothetical protein
VRFPAQVERAELLPHNLTVLIRREQVSFHGVVWDKPAAFLFLMPLRSPDGFRRTRLRRMVHRPDRFSENGKNGKNGKNGEKR